MYVFLISALIGGKLSASRPGCSTSRTRCGPQSWSWPYRNCLPARSQSLYRLHYCFPTIRFICCCQLLLLLWRADVSWTALLWTCSDVANRRSVFYRRLLGHTCICSMLVFGTNWLNYDRLCGLVVRVLGYRSGGPVRFLALPKKSSGSGTGSTQPREYNWGATV
jgi:hypothetical protein